MSYASHASELHTCRDPYRKKRDLETAETGGLGGVGGGIGGAGGKKVGGFAGGFKKGAAGKAFFKGGGGFKKGTTIYLSRHWLTVYEIRFQSGWCRIRWRV